MARSKGVSRVHRMNWWVTETLLCRSMGWRSIVMKYRIVKNLFLVLLMSPFVLTSRTDAANASATIVSTTTRGVKLSLSIPRRTYPRNALVTVTVRLQNVSRHTVLVSVNNYPDAIVLDSTHQEVYSARDPLGDRALLELTGPGPRPPMRVRSHRVLVASYFVVLRGPLLQANAMVGPRGKEHDIHGPILPLMLTSEAPPPVTVMETPTLHAIITPPPGVSAPPYFVERAQCVDNDIMTGRGWQAAPTDDLTPEFATDCTKPGAWVAVAGWLNHPVVNIAWKGQ